MKVREQRAALAEWFEGKPFEELGAVEFDGRVLFPDSLKSRNAKGQIVEKQVMVRVLRQAERAKARKEARDWMAKLGLHPEIDVEHFDSLDTVCLVARAVREPKEPYEQHKTYEDLANTYESRSIVDLWDRLNVYDRLLEPRPDTLTDADFAQLVHELRKAGNLRPLVAIAGSAQDSFVLRMAADLSNCMTGKCSSRLAETSTSSS